MLTKTDKKILSLLDTNPRISQSEISRTLGIPQQTVNYRINRMLTGGDITKFATLIDFMKLGFKEYHLFFRTRDYTNNKTRIWDYFSKHPNIWWAAKIGSYYDIMIQAVVQAPEDIEQIIDNMNNSFGGIFSNENIFEVIKHEMFTHPFLSNQLKKRYIYEQTNNLVVLSEKEWTILKLIKDNCRIPLLRIVKETKLDFKTVKNKIRSLQERKIILGYRLFHSIKSRKAYLALIKYGGFSREALNKLISDIYGIREFTHYWKLIGEYNLIIHARCENYEQFHDIFASLREHNKIIKSYVLIPVFRDIIVNTLPCEQPHPSHT